MLIDTVCDPLGVFNVNKRVATILSHFVLFVIERVSPGDGLFVAGVVIPFNFVICPTISFDNLLCYRAVSNDTLVVVHYETVNVYHVFFVHSLSFCKRITQSNPRVKTYFALVTSMGLNQATTPMSP